MGPLLEVTECSQREEVAEWMGTKPTNGRRKSIKKLQPEVTKPYYTSLLPIPLSSNPNQREHFGE